MMCIESKSDASAHEGNVHPLRVSDPKIRVQLQLAGLRYMITRANWLISEANILGIALKAGLMTSAEVDAELDRMGALDLVYPDLMIASMERGW
ncbi:MULTISPECIES: hypothetical protein [unclassified Bradyrhizobium]|uniref:hypothetical protein n=1 Tax=unclassified Bradyrhizobium TaxID=2631580 RepID=UPI002916A158|nr:MULTISPECIES: hypothetical protein [unclassified Bradyrhizobium]